jgi:hypothetical protein
MTNPKETNMPTTPDLSEPGTHPYRDPYDAQGNPLPPQAYNGSKDIYGQPIAPPLPTLPGNAPEGVDEPGYLPEDPRHPDNAPVVDVAPADPVVVP